MTFDLTGAAISRAVMGDGPGGVIPPVVIASLVAASWALRLPRAPPGAAAERP
jgi:hypothetical protein